jgi:hypothetical protein
VQKGDSTGCFVFKVTDTALGTTYGQSKRFLPEDYDRNVWLIVTEGIYSAREGGVRYRRIQVCAA